MPGAMRKSVGLKSGEVIMFSALWLHDIQIPIRDGVKTKTCGAGDDSLCAMKGDPPCPPL
jgi:hypothetical protein